MDKTAIRSEIERIDAGIRRQQQEIAVAKSILAALSAERANEAVGDDGAAALVSAVLAALRDQITQADAELERIVRSQQVQRKRLETARADQEIIAQKFVPAQALRQRGTISESDYLDRLRELKAADAEVSIAERELDELAAEAEVQTKRRASIITTAVSAYRQKLNDAEIALQSLGSELQAANTQLANMSLHAPTNGRVEHLSVFTIGGFAEAGDTLMSIVPSNGDIEIEAFFDNRDIGFLETGQPAFIKFDAFPAERFGIVRGRVTGVGADARGDIVPGKWVYAVRLKLDQRTIQMPKKEVPFVSGMTATIDVITGDRRLIAYVFEPILKAIQDSFGER
jgi:hemolysin D